MMTKYYRPPPPTVSEHYWPPIRTEGMKRIQADFNTGMSIDGLLALDTDSSVQSLRDTGAQVGEKVVLTDGDVWVEALLVKQDGVMYARFNWNDIEEVVKEGTK